MVRFLAVFITVYGLLNVYVLSKVRFLLPDRPATPFLLLFFLALMVLAPIGARLSESHGHLTLARLIAYPGYSWMGLVFLAFWLFLLADMVTLLAKWTQVAPFLRNPVLKSREATGFLFVVVAVLFLHGLLEARSIRTERVTVVTEKLPPGVSRLRIVQISDVHLGIMVGERRLENILQAVERAEPDLMVLTGDMVDGNLADGEGLIRQLSGIQPPLGKFAVTGNHEHYAGIEQSVAFLRKCGFRVLRGEGVNVEGIITIVGVDDAAGQGASDESDLLASLQGRRFVLLLKHRPQVADGSRGRFDLQLSGHAHRGQIFPFRFFTGIRYPMQDGLHQLEGGGKLYASRGTGTWGPPIRLLSPPEVTVIDVISPDYTPNENL
ncbi:MAG: metallophosphoesterase [Deltaproteobacteria bacterium]|nr:metallophosphoesterase [Deltaproteobacteria bacterium]